MLRLAFAECSPDTVVEWKSSERDARAHLAGEIPTLVIVDLKLGATRGTELVSALRAEERFRGTPVVVLTGSPDLEDRSLSRRSGADAVFTKPETPDGYRELVRNLLHYLG